MGWGGVCGDVRVCFWMYVLYISLSTVYNMYICIYRD